MHFPYVPFVASLDDGAPVPMLLIYHHILMVYLLYVFVKLVIFIDYYFFVNSRRPFFWKDDAISLVSRKTHEKVGFFYTENIHAYTFILLSIRELIQWLSLCWYGIGSYIWNWLFFDLLQFHRRYCLLLTYFRSKETNERNWSFFCFGGTLGWALATWLWVLLLFSRNTSEI